jgi:hypothetical protein
LALKGRFFVGTVMPNLEEEPILSLLLTATTVVTPDAASVSRKILHAQFSRNGGAVLATLFPQVADNRYPGRRLGLWLFALMLLKIAMGLNVMLNAPTVAKSADGIPVDSFVGPAGPAFFSIFAAWGLCQLVLGLSCLVVLLRYRSLVPLAFLALLVEQAGRKLLQLYWPIERMGTPVGIYVNAALLGIMVLGLACSLWRPHARARAA